MAVEVRGGRSASPRARRGPVVAVTGAAHGVGAVVARALSADPRIGGVVGVDLDPAPAADGDGVTWRTADVREPGVAAALDGVDALVHLALDLAPDTDRARQRALNTRGTATVLTAAFAVQVRRVVLMTSAMVYGALPDNPVPLADDAPLRAVPEASVLGDLVEIERLAARSARSHPGMGITVLRPAWLLGRGVESAAAGMFDAPRLLVVRGAHPRWQFCHVDDLADAIALAVRGDVDGVATVASEGWLEQEQVEEITGRRRLELPASVAYGTAERLHRIGVTPAPPSEIGYLVHPWVVASTRLRAAGWTPRHTNEEALRDHVATHAEPRGPRVDARGATAAAGAAGAAVALVGTAALVRRARRRRQGPR